MQSIIYVATNRFFVWKRKQLNGYHLSHELWECILDILSRFYHMYERKKNINYSMKIVIPWEKMRLLPDLFWLAMAFGWRQSNSFATNRCLVWKKKQFNGYHLSHELWECIQVYFTSSLVFLIMYEKKKSSCWNYVSYTDFFLLFYGTSHTMRKYEVKADLFWLAMVFGWILRRQSIYFVTNKREFWREFAIFCTISFIKIFLKSFFEHKKKMFTQYTH
jgi:hypothetical protein